MALCSKHLHVSVANCPECQAREHASDITQLVREVTAERKARRAAEDRETQALAQLDDLMKAAQACIDSGHEEGWIYYNGTDESRLDRLEDALEKAWDPLESTCRHASLSIL